MKKLLMATVILLSFSLSILIIQTSCSKIAAQSSNNSARQQNKIIYLKNWGSTAQIWTSDYDGTNAAQVPVTLPANVTFDNSVTFSLSISPDGQKIFFSAHDTLGSPLVRDIYSCDISGANVISVASGAVGTVQAY